MHAMTKIVWVVLMTPLVAMAGEMGAALKGDAIRAEPFNDAQVMAALAAGDMVEIVKREGGWLQVRANGQQGWVHMLSIRRNDARKGTGEAAGVLGLPSGRSGTGGLVATTGIRGMSIGSVGAASGVAAASTGGNGEPGEQAAGENEQEGFEVK